MKAYLARADRHQRIMAEDAAQQNTEAFAIQYAEAEAQAQARVQSSKQVTILSRSDRGYESGEDMPYWR